MCSANKRNVLRNRQRKINLMKESKHLEHSCSKKKGYLTVSITNNTWDKVEKRRQQLPQVHSRPRQAAKAGNHHPRSLSWASSVALCSSPWITPSVPLAGWNTSFWRTTAKYKLYFCIIYVLEDFKIFLLMFGSFVWQILYVVNWAFLLSPPSCWAFNLSPTKDGMKGKLGIQC